VLGECRDLRTSKDVMRRDKVVLYNWVLSQYWNQNFRRALTLVADPAFCVLSVPSVCFLCACCVPSVCLLCPFSSYILETKLPSRQNVSGL